jgi:hypothetical protein
MCRARERAFEMVVEIVGHDELAAVDGRVVHVPHGLDGLLAGRTEPARIVDAFLVRTARRQADVSAHGIES